MLALGKTVRNALAREGVFPVAYRWWYDRAIHRRFPFPPHRRLHAQIIPFENYPVPNPSGWPLLLKPGDHRGCRCLLSYLLRGPDGRFLRRQDTPTGVPTEFRTPGSPPAQPIVVPEPERFAVEETSIWSGGDQVDRYQYNARLVLQGPNGEYIGEVVVALFSPDKTATVEWITIAEEYRRQGWATVLMDEVEARWGGEWTIKISGTTDLGRAFFDARRMLSQG